MNLAELADLGSLPDDAPVAFEAIIVDSRQARPGCLFAAMPGTRVDGLSFAEGAVRRGAVAVLAGEGAPATIAGAPVLRCADPRRALALAAARLHPRQPARMVAVTGTAGKTSVASFARQVWAATGTSAAMIGTTGVVAPGRESYGSLTTPDPVALHALLDGLAGEGVEACAMEASSHGLDQRRLDGVALLAGAFTNLGRDHMDYHPTMEHYLASKLRLFDTLLEPGQPAVVNGDDAYSAPVIEACERRGLRVLTVGRRGAHLAVKRIEQEQYRQIAEVQHEGRTHRVALPLAGEFQLSNALVAAGLAIATGTPAGTALAALEHLKGASGRLDLVGKSASGAPVYVDYAHKPDALENVLRALRPYTTGRLVLVFGCGGDRDRGKRPIMGAIAERLADTVIVTDDNPRSEEPADVRAAILAQAPGATEIADRREAIRHAVAHAGTRRHARHRRQGPRGGADRRRRDAALLGPRRGARSAGGARNAGHAQSAGHARSAGGALMLWSVQDMAAAMEAEIRGEAPEGVVGLSIDTRTLRQGEAYFAILGEVHDGHDFVPHAEDAGAALAVVSRERADTFADLGLPLLVVDDVLEGLERLGVAARDRTRAMVVAVTGSVGKTTTKELLRAALGASGSVHAAVASFNNHWGVPLTLARMPADTDYAVVEIGMNHPGEITPLVRMAAPHVAVITLVAAAHLGAFASVDEIARAKAEIFDGLVEGGVALLNADDPRLELLKAEARDRGVRRIVTFGKAGDVRRESVRLGDESSTLNVRIAGETFEATVGAPGGHVVQNALAALGACYLVGADMAAACRGLAAFTAGKGRGERHRLDHPDGPILLIDESYNANPASMVAGIRALRVARPGPGGRRIAVLGDMLELGARSAALHAHLAEPLSANAIDLVLLAGDQMAALRDRLQSATGEGGAAGPEVRWFAATPELATIVADEVRAHDVVMVKSSQGLGFAAIVDRLKEAYPPQGEG